MIQILVMMNVLKYEIYIIMKWLKQFMEYFSLFMKQMLSYNWKSGKNIESKNPKIARTKIRRIMLLSKCALCDSKKLKFIKEQETSGSSSSLEIKTPFNKINSVSHLLC